MSANSPLLPVDRFLQTLSLVFREGNHLAYSYGRLYSQPIDVVWVQGLDISPELAERLEARKLRDRLRDFAAKRMAIDAATLPGMIALPEQD